MAFTFAYDLSDESMTVKDYVLSSGYTPAKGDNIVLNASGQLVAPAANAATILGVFEGGAFQGLVASGQPYAATTVTQNEESTNNYGKVRVAQATTVWKVPLKSGAAAPTIGVKYGCASGVAPTGANAVIDTSNTATGAIYQVVDYNSTTQQCFVTITGRQYA